MSTKVCCYFQISLLPENKYRLKKQNSRQYNLTDQVVVELEIDDGKAQLRKHLVCKSEEKNILCDICYVALRRKHDMLQHRNRHISKKKFFCQMCNTCLTNKSSLNKHIVTQHTGKNFLCEICQRAFSRKDNLKQHMLCHSEREIYICQFSNKEFMNKQHCKKYERDHSKAGLDIYEARKIECYISKRMFLRKDNSTRHILGYLKKKYKEQFSKHTAICIS